MGTGGTLGTGASLAAGLLGTLSWLESADIFFLQLMGKMEASGSLRLHSAKVIWPER